MGTKAAILILDVQLGLNSTGAHLLQAVGVHDESSWLTVGVRFSKDLI